MSDAPHPVAPNFIFVDCEADAGHGREREGGQCPALHRLTQIGAVVVDRRAFHADLRLPLESATFPSREYEVAALFAEWIGQVVPRGQRPIMWSDNPAYDWQWINDLFCRTLRGYNPLGYSARRIGDFYSGLVGDLRAANRWKRMRRTKHTHHPVDDALGNLEAFERMLAGERV